MLDVHWEFLQCRLQRRWFQLYCAWRHQVWAIAEHGLHVEDLAEALLYYACCWEVKKLPDNLPLAAWARRALSSLFVSLDVNNILLESPPTLEEGCSAQTGTGSSDPRGRSDNLSLTSEALTQAGGGGGGDQVLTCVQAAHQDTHHSCLNQN